MPAGRVWLHSRVVGSLRQHANFQSGIQQAGRKQCAPYQRGNYNDGKGEIRELARPGMPVQARYGCSPRPLHPLGCDNAQTYTDDGRATSHLGTLYEIVIRTQRRKMGFCQRS